MAPLLIVSVVLALAQAVSPSAELDQPLTPAALSDLQHKAANGDSAAQNHLGVLYRHGLGVDKSQADAVRWFRKAAKQGNSTAMFNIAASYYNGEGVAVDEAQAYTWFLLAAEGGSVPARDGVERLGAPLSPAERAEAFRKAGDMCLKGEEVPKDFDKALKWAERAAKAGDTDSMLWLAETYQEGRGVPKNAVRGLEWCRLAANNLSASGMYCLGHLYHEGIAVPKDFGLAAKWFAKAVEGAHVQAAYELGEMYLSGETGKVDRKKAFFYFVLSATAQFAPAESARGQLLGQLSARETESVKKDVMRWIVAHQTPALARSLKAH